MADSNSEEEAQERQRHLQTVTRKLVSLTGGCIIALLIYFYIIIKIAPPQQTYLVVIVFTAGLIGGFVSIQQRLPRIGLGELRELSTSWLSILLIPVNGGIFALVLMLLFVSGIVEGALFPKYGEMPPFDHKSLEELMVLYSSWLKTTFPATGPDIAKLLFWSFVAGFSERFVPQIIRKTTDNAGQK